MCHTHSSYLNHHMTHSHLQGKTRNTRLKLQIWTEKALGPHTNIHPCTPLQTCVLSQSNFQCSLQVCSMIWYTPDGEVNCCLSAQHIDQELLYSCLEIVSYDYSILCYKQYDPM